jgi:hypothetical protein
VPAALRPAPERAVRSVLRIPEVRPRGAEDRAQRIFGTSMVLSGLRCLLGYVIFPFVLPAVGLGTGAAPWIGIPIGVTALVFDALGIRRFWLADHEWRWPVSAVYLTVMVMVAYLVGTDVAHLL